MTGKQKAYREELTAQLEQWNAQVDHYAAKANGATDRAQDEYFEITAALQRMQDEARMRLERLPLRADDEDADGLDPDRETASADVKFVL